MNEDIILLKKGLLFGSMKNTAKYSKNARLFVLCDTIIFKKESLKTFDKFLENLDSLNISDYEEFFELNLEHLNEAITSEFFEGDISLVSRNSEEEDGVESVDLVLSMYDKFFKINFTYESYSGYNINWSLIKQVYPVKKEVVVYE